METENTRLKDRAKRAIDLAVSGAMLAVLWPVMLAVALAIRVRMGSPVLFRQLRPGLNGETFEMMKFRTMVHAPGGKKDRPDGAISDIARVTPLGAWLRATSLDELPELINVFKGEMSLVGPRPLLPQYMEHYDDHQRRRHDVKPGITGLAQVEGRNDLSWTERFDTDVRYVDTWTISGDLQILVQTLKVALSGEGTEDTVEDFDDWLAKRQS